MQKISLFHQFIEIQQILEPYDQKGHIHFLGMPTLIFFNQFLIFLNFYQHAKNSAILSFSSRDIIDLKTQQSDRPRAF